MASYLVTFMFPAIRRGFLPLLLLLAGGQLSAAQTPTQSPPVQSPAASAGSASQASATPATDIQLPGDLAKIQQRVLAQKTFTLLDTDAMRFYVSTVAPFPKFLDIVGDFNLRAGAVPHSGMTHQEFVQSTHPKEMYSAAGFTTSDMLRLTFLSYVEGKAFELMRKGGLALRDAHTEAERKAIQARIEKELAALKSNVR